MTAMPNAVHFNELCVQLAAARGLNWLALSFHEQADIRRQLEECLAAGRPVPRRPVLRLVAP
jgi:hypothetical protein